MKDALLLAELAAKAIAIRVESGVMVSDYARIRDFLMKDVVNPVVSLCAATAADTKAPKSIGRDKGKHHEAGAQHAGERILRMRSRV